MMHDPTIDQMVICQPADQQHSNRVEYQVKIAGKTYQPYFDSPRVALSGSVEAAVCMASLGAMRHNLDILITEPISKTFLDNQQKLMGIFTHWFPEFSLPRLKVEHTHQAEPKKSGRVGSFFTGGVDSL